MRNLHRLLGSTALAAALVVAPFAASHVSAADEDIRSLRGVVLDGSGAVANAEVAVSILGGTPAAGDFAASARSDEDGKFEIGKSPFGPTDVWVRPEGGKWTFVIRMWHPGVNDLQVDARPKADFRGFGDDDAGGGKLTGIVTDKKGTALAGAAIAANGSKSDWALTDAQGRFTLEPVSKGDNLLVRAPGFSDLLTKAKPSKSGMKIKLAPAKVSVVHVKDAAGAPVEGAWVVFGDQDRVLGTTGFTALFPPCDLLAGAWTDAAGDARVTYGGSDDPTFATAYGAHASPGRKKIKGIPKRVELQLGPLRPARVSVILRENDGAVPGVFVGLPSEYDGGPDAISALPAEADRGPIVMGRTGDDGTCVVRDLAPEVKTLRVVGELKIRSRVELERINGEK